MDLSTRLPRRLGTIALSGALAAGMCSVGLLTAGAAGAATDAVTIQSQFTGGGSTLNDGTNSTVKISATTQGNLANVARVEFSVQKAGSAPVILGSDTSAPYSIEWSPSSTGNWTETATSYAANNIEIASSTRAVAVSSTASSVHVSSPTDGGALGVFTNGKTLSDAGTIAVGGTRSSDNPALSVTAADRNNTDGSVTQPGAATAVAAGTSGTAADQAWKAAVAVPAGTANANGNDVVVYASAGSGNPAASDEVAEGTLYLQQVTTFNAPANQTVVAGASTNFVLTALDQNGKPIAGLTVTATDTSHTGADATLNTASPVTTDANGQATFKVTAPAGSGSTTYTFQTNINGTSYQIGTDFSRTATLSYGTQTATSLAFKLRPQKAVYAGQSEYTGSNPVVDLCVLDQNGQPLTATTAPGNLIVTDTRTVGTGPAGAATSPALTADTTAGYTNCYKVTYAPASGSYGTDAFSAYLETNGTPGQQSGENGATVTTKWANLTIPNRATQGAKGTNVAGSFTVVGTDGTPFANRQINLTLTGGTNASFPATQPAGTTVNAGGNTAATCTTDSNGVCAYNVTEATNNNASETVNVTASDTITTGDQVSTGATGTEAVTFTNSAPTLSTITDGGEQVSYPGGVVNAAPGEPGTILIQKVLLKDQSGNVLANVPVTITTDHGFFTAVPAGNAYTNGSFDPAIAGGNLTGNVKPNATPTTFTGTTDNSGMLTFAMGIGKDAGFDDDGDVLSTLKFTASGGSATFSPYTNTGGNNNSAITWSTDANNIGYVQTPLNPGAIKFAPVAPTTTLAGATQSDYSVNPDFAVHLTDQFGNLVHVNSNNSAEVKVTGPATVGGATDFYDNGSYTANPTDYRLVSNATSTTKSDATVTGTWTASTSKFTAAAAGNPPVTTYGVDNTGTATSTDSFTVSEYLIDEKNLHYDYKVTPADIVTTGTTVHDIVTVTDQYSQPVVGLYVNFDQSGPLSTDDYSSSARTNTAGQGGYNFSSAAQGNSTVTTTVYDCDIQNPNCSGIPLSESVNKVGFDGVPSISATSRTGTGPITIAGKTRPGASVQLQFHGLGDTTFVNVGSPITAGPDGSYSFTPTVRKSNDFRVVADKIATSATRMSTVKTANIVEKPVVVLVSKVKGNLGVRVGTSPVLKNVSIQIYSMYGGVRHVIRTVNSGSKGAVFTVFNGVQSGRVVTIQAKVLTPAGYTSQFSDPQSLAVK